MIEGIRDDALRAGIVDKTIFDNGIRDLYRTAEADGVFCYTFFKAVAGKKWDPESERREAHRFYESLGYKSETYKGFKKRLNKSQ